MHPNYLYIETYHLIVGKLAKIFAKCPILNTFIKFQIYTQTLALPKKPHKYFQKSSATIQTPHNILHLINILLSS